jgi:N-acetylmuramoyl-L-alanine amidase
MHHRFKMNDDAENARKKFLEFADRYPGDDLADDALFEAAALTAHVQNKKPDQPTLYRQIIKQYPKSNHAAKVIALLQSQPTPALQPTVTALPDSPKKSTDSFARLSTPTFWSSAQYGRIVVNVDKSIPFKVHRTPAQPDQLILDLEESSVDAPQRVSAQVDNGLIRQVTTSQPRTGTVRFHIDSLPFTEYKVFSLNNPFRVILDIYGLANATGEEENPSTSVEPVEIQTQRASPASTPAEKVTADIVFLQDQKKVRALPKRAQIQNRKEPLSLAQQLGLGVKTIVIDPGHGGKDPGAMAFGLKEKDIVLKVAKKLAKILRENFHYRVVLTRSNDVFIPLEQRTAIANNHKADLFISIHVNANGNQTHSGIETYFLNLATDADAMRVAALENASSTHSIGELQHILSSLMNNSKIDESSRLARFVQSNLINGFKSTAYKPRDLGVKQAPFYVLIGAEMPAILAELTFITNPEEAELLKDDRHLQSIAQQLAGGIVAYVDHHHAGVLIHY